MISSSSYSSFFLFIERPTARLVSPETMIHSPNCFVLPCAGPFHKIDAGCEATTTVNSSCLMYGYYFDAILLHDKGAALRMYTCAYLRLYANPEKYVEQVQTSFNMDVGMNHVKNRGNKEIPLAILSRIHVLAQSCVTPPYIIQAKGYA